MYCFRRQLMSQELHLTCCEGSRYATAKTLCLRFFALYFSKLMHSAKVFSFFFVFFSPNCSYRQKQPLKGF